MSARGGADEVSKDRVSRCGGNVLTRPEGLPTEKPRPGVVGHAAELPAYGNGKTA